MHETNICSSLEVKPINFEQALPKSLYSKQYELQERLGQVGSFTDKEIAEKLIYWRHCIHTECDELLEWFFGDDLDTVAKKEARMEMVDILHFVFNMGITLNLTSLEVQRVYDESAVVLDMTVDKLDVRLKIAICSLSESISTLIDLLPWKTWKKYPEYKADFVSITKAYGHVVARTYALGYLLDLHDQEIGEYFIAKNLENHARQDRGY